MTYAIRNSVIIFCLVVLVLIFNTVTRNNTIKKLEAVTTVYDQKNQELETLKRVNPDLEKEKEIMAQHDEMQFKAMNRTKFILRQDNPTLAYDYLTSIVDRFTPGMIFDFRVESGGKLHDTNFNAYTLTGQTSLQNYYRFLYHVENQSPLVKVSGKSISEVEEIIPAVGRQREQSVKRIDFSLRLQFFHDTTGRTYEDLAIQNLPAKSVLGNPFRARIAELPEDVTQKQYVDVANARIVGFSAQKLTLRQGDGRTVILQTGDKVAYGYLHEINWDDEYGLFKINKVGITQDVKLYVERD